jgi:hypothetical protein
VTGEGFVSVFNDPKLHDYIIDFAKSNLRADRQACFVQDVWCDIGRLPHEEPSFCMVAEVVWRVMIRYEPILQRLAEGYTTREVAEEDCVSQTAIMKRKKKACRGVQNTP